MEISKSYLSQCISKNKDCGGFIWKYIITVLSFDQLLARVEYPSEYFVKWYGRASDFNQWIASTDFDGPTLI